MPSFRRKVMWALHTAPWIVFGILCFYPQAMRKELHFIPEYLTWSFDMSNTLGEVMHWFNFVFCSLCAIVETTFNVLSLIGVHKMRKLIGDQVSSQNQRREAKLLIQCFIIGCFFVAAEVVFTIAYACGWSTQGKLLFMQLVWTSNHCVNPIVYLIMNQKLRARFLDLITFGRWQKTTASVQSIEISSRTTPKM